ncbi:MAG: fasciclin domain-containing protein, partial [Candidatus Promineifilaceae bacterium]|nr:fasciclin domain-containing protein [Candidatus Promineifilaceae bacterium]
NGIVHVIDAVLLPPSNTVVDVVVNSDVHNTLETAVIQAELAGALSGEGPFTVFAPTDDAFAALPEGTVEALLEDPEGSLMDILLYHVVDGAVPAEAVVTQESVTTLQGEPIAINVENGVVILDETAEVIITDIEASNGVIHVIDAVILPPSMREVAKEDTMDAQSIAEIATADGRFNTLVAAVQAAGLAETLSGDGEFTVFAPTDEAFAALPAGMVEALLQDPEGALKDILLYHVVEGAVPAEAVVTADSATTIQGEPVSIKTQNGAVVLNDSANVVITDIEASNGLIHVIDAVILPPSMSDSTAETEMSADMVEDMSITEIAVADGRFTTLVAALEAAGLAETLASEGDFTVFAPVDDAFTALPDGTLEALLEDPQGDLTDILLYHVVEGAVPAETVVTLDSATTLNEQDVTITVNDDGVFLNDEVQVIVTDIAASNGIIHVIDGVLLPVVDEVSSAGMFAQQVSASEYDSCGAKVNA